jgi:hypothetical protein
LQNKVCKIFTNENLQRIAVKSGFYKRSSKMLPSKFFDILMHSASFNGHFSLARFCGEAFVTYDVPITKQAFDDRFNDSAISFVKGILDEVLANQIETPLDSHFLEKFQKVKIKDATRFDLPKCLKEYFPGFGGCATSDAAASIQYEFDLKTRKLYDLDITSALKTDMQDAQEKADDIESGDLIIRDLGYFSSKVVNVILEKKAFFLSRLRTIMDVFDDNQQKVSFKELHNHMVKHNKTRHLMQVAIGNKERIPVRLLIELISEEAYQERVRKREKEGKKKGWKMTEEFKARARFSLMITNVPEEDLPIENMYKLYKTRWQIELIFKTWKSVLGINNIHPMRYHRLMCLLYTKFILFLVNSQVTGLIAKKLYNQKKMLLSFNKSLKTLQVYFAKTREVFTIHKMSLTSYCEEMFQLFSKNHWLEKRNNKIGFEELFNIFIC